MRRAFNLGLSSILGAGLWIAFSACSSSEPARTTTGGGTTSAGQSTGSAPATGSGSTGETTGGQTTGDNGGDSASGATGTTGASTSETTGSATTGTDATTGFDDSIATGGVTGGFVYDAGKPPSDVVCQQFAIPFTPQIPTVFVLVDRSGSMFDPRPNSTENSWDLLKAGILTVIQPLAAQVRFGFGAFTGEQPGTGDGICPAFNEIDPALDNYDKINTLYGSLMRPTKGETPTAEVLGKVRDILLADTDPTAKGPKYILFVTDGEPDFCDDNNSLCPEDAVIGSLQELKQQGIGTFIFGVPAGGSATLQADFSVALQDFANAGAGQPVGPLSMNGRANIDPTTLFDQCQGRPPWLALFTTPPTRGAAGQTLGTYIDADSGPAGNATVYSPDPTNQQALDDAIKAALNNVKSCSFDLSQSDVEVDLAQASKGTIVVDGKTIPFDATNGWQMSSPTVLQLVGTACDGWKQSGMNISGTFPCEVIKPRV